MSDNDPETSVLEERGAMVESLIDHAEEYAKTNLYLLQLRAVEKASFIASKAITGGLVILLTLIFLLIANIALALWIGELVGSNVYGFLIVAGFYALAAIVIQFVFGKSIQRGIMNSIIKNAFD